MPPIARPRATLALAATAGLVACAFLGVRHQEPRELRKATSLEAARVKEQARAPRVLRRGALIDRRATTRWLLIPQTFMFPHFDLWVVVVLVACATALSFPKSQRWLMLGGHGRHGAG